MTAALLALYLAAPFVCVVAVPPARGRGGPAARVVLGVALYEALLFVIGTALGLAGLLTPRAYAACTLVVVAALAPLAWRHRPRAVTRARPRRPRWLRWLTTRRGCVVALAAACVVAAFGVQLRADAALGTRHYDGLWYHLPRILAWVGQGSFAPWPTPTWQQLALPVGADVVLGAKLFLGLGWAGTAWVPAVLVVGATACVYAAALDLGLDRWRAAMAATLFATFPAVGARVWALNSDLAAAFPVLAGYVALRRARDPGIGLAALVLLVALGIACKPTVAPLAAALAAAALWRDRRRLARPRVAAFAALAVLAGAAAALASYWPMYAAFHDLAGGEMGRLHVVHGLGNAARSVAASALHWALEPLGYLPPPARAVIPGIVESAYRPLGVFDVALRTTPSSWEPLPAPDTGITGIATVLAVPWLSRSLPPRARLIAAPLWLGAFVVVSGAVYPQPWSGRFTIVLLAAFALMWAMPRAFRSGRGAALLSALVALNASLLLATTIWLARSAAAGAGPRLAQLDPASRSELATLLRGAPLPVMTSGSTELMLGGPEVAFAIRYVVCSEQGDWRAALRAEQAAAPFLALVHDGSDRIGTGPRWARPGAHRCEPAARGEVEAWLAAGGWRPWRRAAAVDVWGRPKDGPKDAAGSPGGPALVR